MSSISALGLSDLAEDAKYVIVAVPAGVAAAWALVAWTVWRDRRRKRVASTCDELRPPDAPSEP